MAVDKGKVKAALDTKYKGTSLSKNFKEQFAAAAAEAIDDEAGVDEYINTYDGLIRLTIAENDRRATEATAKARQDAADAAAGKTKTDPQKQEGADELPPETPEWAKALLKQNQQLAAKVEGFERAKQAETLADRFKKDERLKGIPDFMLRRAIPQKEEDFDTAVTELATEYQAFAEQNKLAGFGGDVPPGSRAGGAGSQSGKVDPDIVAFGKAKAAAVTSNN